MTENKRYSFNWERGHPNFWDNHCDLADCYLTCADVVDRLNELHEENQLLHKINEDTIDFMYDNFDSNIIFTDRELNDICNEMGWELSEKGIKINQLEKENEQLKQSYKEFEDECQSTFNAMNRTQNVLYHKNFKLKEEIEQLKQHNTELITKIDFLERVIDGDV